jgi:hypothetical protein
MCRHDWGGNRSYTRPSHRRVRRDVGRSLRRTAAPFIPAPFAGHGVAWGRGRRIALGGGLTLRSCPRSNPLAPTGAVVTQDVPPRTVVAGNPATVVREL